MWRDARGRRGSGKTTSVGMVDPLVVVVSVVMMVGRMVASTVGPIATTALEEGAVIIIIIIFNIFNIINISRIIVVIIITLHPFGLMPQCNTPVTPTRNRLAPACRQRRAARSAAGACAPSGVRRVVPCGPDAVGRPSVAAQLRAMGMVGVAVAVAGQGAHPHVSDAMRVGVAFVE